MGNFFQTLNQLFSQGIESYFTIKRRKSQYDEYVRVRDTVVNSVLKLRIENISINGFIHTHGIYGLSIGVRNPEESENYNSEVKILKGRYKDFLEGSWEDVEKEVEGGNPKTQLERELLCMGILNKLDNAQIPVWASCGGILGFLYPTRYPIAQFTQIVKEKLAKGKEEHLLLYYHLDDNSVVIGESLLVGDGLSIEAFLDKDEREKLNKNSGPGTHYKRINQLCSDLRDKGANVQIKVYV